MYNSLEGGGVGEGEDDMGGRVTSPPPPPSVSARKALRGEEEGARGAGEGAGEGEGEGGRGGEGGGSSGCVGLFSGATSSNEAGEGPWKTPLWR